MTFEQIINPAVVTPEEWQRTASDMAHFRGSSMLVAMSLAYADGAHSAIQQMRKYTDHLGRQVPYIYHPMAVARIVTLADVAVYSRRDFEIMIAAAHLHDTREDTGVEESDLSRIFPEEVIRMVDELSDIEYPEGQPKPNRKTRKAADRDRLAKISDRGQTVKVADCIANGFDIVTQDRNFAKVYIREMRELHPRLDRADKGLHTRMGLMLDLAEQDLFG